MSAAPDVRQVHPALIEVAAGRPLPQVDDPAPLLRDAVAYGMSGLLLAALQDVEAPWRSRALAALSVRRAQARRWHERLWATLADLTSVLDALDIQVAVAKGIAAEARWYDATGERPCSDLDLLLRPDDIARLDEVVAAIEPSHPLIGRLRVLAETGRVQSVDLVYDGIPIDLHWDLFKLFIPSRNRDLIWERVVTLPLPDGRKVRVIDAETSFTHFLLHLNKDRFRRLMGYADVARIHQREDLDLDAVRLMTRNDGLEVSVANAWDVVTETLGLPRTRPVPLPRSPVGRLRSAVWRRAWRPEIRLRAEESVTRYWRRQWLIPFLARGRVLETAWYWLRALIPPKDFIAYIHSEYATRWGQAPTAATENHSRLWLLTVARVRAAATRRRKSGAAHERARERSAVG